MATEKLSDVSLLQGKVPQGIINRYLQFGGIPEKGPGSLSIPNALKRERSLRDQTPTTLQERRAQNRALFPRGY